MTKKENDAKRAPLGAHPKGTKQNPTKGFAQIELVPDAWPRFERFIKEIVKAGPQHRVSTAKPKAKASPKASSPEKRRSAKAKDP